MAVSSEPEAGWPYLQNRPASTSQRNCSAHLCQTVPAVLCQAVPAVLAVWLGKITVLLLAQPARQDHLPS